MFPLLTLIGLIPGLGGLVEHGKAWLLETLAWLAVAAAIAAGGAVAYEHVYDRGLAAGTAQTEALRLQVGTLKAQVAQATAAAQESAASAEGLAQQLTDQAEAAETESAQAHADADRYTAALEAARSARCEVKGGAVPDAVHQALTGHALPAEDAPLPGSLRDAVRALRKGGHR